ncbi:aspartate aminotransferase family protein [Archaeoglobales archaeon]|nr:MAG: aspartate aminotransferase family protein [Archaeoglobales archaeon]
MKSREIYERGLKIIPKAAQTGLRSETHYPEPFIPETAYGCKIKDVDGKVYTDYHLAFGPIVLGHNHPEVNEVIKEQINKGVLFGAGLCELEVEVAEKIIDLIPSAELVNFVNSGTEATYHAIRLSRAYTGREKIVKFEGCYHGWHDYVAFNVNPPADNMGKIYPQSKGILKAAYDTTLILPFNDSDAFKELMAEHHDEIAGVILEPIPHSVGAITPKKEFLKTLRKETKTYGSLLIFDEIITAFRHNIHGVQEEFGVIPDITTIGKSMGNGYPIAAIVGKKEVMSMVHNGVLVSGTYSGHPSGLAATKKTIEILERDKVVDYIAKLGEEYRKALVDLIEDINITARVIGYKSIFAIQFAEGEVIDYSSIVGIDREKFKKFAAEMRRRGIFFTPNPMKRCHLCLSHTDKEMNEFLDAASEVLSKLA